MFCVDCHGQCHVRFVPDVSPMPGHLLQSAMHCILTFMLCTHLVFNIRRARKDVIRANAHLLSKVTHSAPLQVADQIMWWAAGSPNAVEPLAEIMKLPNNLTIDALTYMVSLVSIATRIWQRPVLLNRL